LHKALEVIQEVAQGVVKEAGLAEPQMCHARAVVAVVVVFFILIMLLSVVVEGVVVVRVVHMAQVMVTPVYLVQ
jgi:hypothetical protein